jgi:hypothetical protein
VNYSRFESLHVDDDDFVHVPKQNLPPMPPEMREAIRLAQTGDPAAKKKAETLAMAAIERSGPEIKTKFNEIHKELSNERLGGLSATNPSAEMPAADSIKDAREKLEQSLAKLQEEQSRLKEQEQKLGQLQGPEDFFRFIEQSGMSHEDIEKMMASSEQEQKELMRATIDKAAADANLEASDALQQANSIAETVEALKTSTAATGKRPKEGSRSSFSFYKKKTAEQRHEPAEAPTLESEGSIERGDTPAVNSTDAYAVVSEVKVLDNDLVVELHVPKIDSMEEVDLSVEPDCVRFVVPSIYNAIVNLPAIIDPDSAQAKFLRRKKLMRLTMQLKK